MRRDAVRHQMDRRECSRAMLALVVAGWLVAALLGSHVSPAWAGPPVAGPWSISVPGEALSHPQVAAGKNGYTVVTWSPAATIRPLSASPSANNRVAVRIRDPRDQNFGPVRRIGRPGASQAQVVIDRSGQATIVFRQPNGRLRFATRRPGKLWTKPRTVSRLRFSSFKLASAVDGGLAVAGLAAGGPKRVHAAVRYPGTRRFRSFRRISLKPASIGNYLDVSIGRRGRAMVGWSGPCPIDSAGAWNARIVTITRPGRASLPRVVRNTKCPSVDLVLEEGGGHTYLLIDGNNEPVWQSVRASVRRPGRWFTRARKILNPGDISLVVKLNVNRKGAASVILPTLTRPAWERSGYQVTRAGPRRWFKPPRPLEGVASDQLLLGAELLPGRRLVTFWESISDWTLSVGAIGPGQAAIRHTNLAESTRPEQMPISASAVSPDKRVVFLWAPRDSAGSTDLRMIETGPR